MYRHGIIQGWITALALTVGVMLSPTTQAAASREKVKDLSPVHVDAPPTALPIWYARKAGRTVLLLGTVAPVPTDLKWRSASLDRLLAGASAIVMPPDVKLKLGVLGRMAAITSASGKTSYADGKTLADVLPKSAYLDVVLANQRVNHNDPALLHYRPGFAAFVLRDAALRDLDFSTQSPVYGYLRLLAKRNGAEVFDPVYSTRLDHPRDYIRNLSGEDAADIACLSSLANLLAQHPGKLRIHAQAWADGDIAEVQATDIHAFDVCRASLLPEKPLAQHGVTDLPGHIRSTWIAAIEDAVQNHQLTVTALPMRLLDDSGGYLAALRLQGFVISGGETSSYSDILQPDGTDEADKPVRDTRLR